MSTRVERSARRTRLWPVGLAYTPAALFALLLPKCPLCIAAQLALLGVIPLPSYTKALVVGASMAIATVVVVMRKKADARCSNCSLTAPGAAR